MKRRFTLPLALVLTLAVVYFQSNNQRDRSEYIEYISNHPYSEYISESELESIPKYDRPDLAMRQNYLMTMDPSTGEVPVNRLVKAFQEQKANRLKSGRMADAIPGVSWEERGPDNVGGRTRAIMWDPNDANDLKLWAAGVAGGIWYNNDVTDVNSSWQNINDFMANLAVTTMAYDPTNTQVFYAGTGEGYFNGDAVRGAGIFKSTDGGSSWNQLSSTDNSTFHYVQNVVVTGNGTVLAATRDGGVQRSIDGGASWTTVLNSSSSGASTSRASDLEIASNGDIYATLGIFSTGSIHQSTDDGLNWSAITPSGGAPERIELAVAPSASSATATTVLYAVASTGSNIDWFKKSSDGGSTWSDLTVPRYRSQSCTESSSDFTRGQAWYDLILAVKPDNPDVVLAGGINVLKSSDGGTNMAEISYWTGGCDTYVHADIHAIVFRPNNPNEVVIGSDGGVSYSSDAGSSSDPTFNDRNKDYAVTQFYAVAAENSEGSDYFLAGSQDNGTQQFTTADGRSTNEVTGGDGAFCFIDQDNSNFQISSYIRNVYYLLNGSGSFIQTLSNDDANGRFINPADYDNTADILYSAGVANELRRISGITTTPNSQELISLALNGEQISAIRADVSTPNRLFLGTGSGGVYQVDNADQATPTVTEITNNISGIGYISSIDVGTSENVMLVTSSSYGVSSIWYTNDGGSSWINKDNDGSLPDMPVRWGLFNPEDLNEVLIATELGVWSTSDITASNPGWEQSSTNLANVRCDMLQYRSADKMVVVATHGRGVFTSDAFAGADENPPLVSSVDPSDNSNEIRLSVNLEVEFNEPVFAGTGNIVIERVSDDSAFETIDVTSGQVTINNTTVVIDPSTDFEPLTEYRVLMDAGTFADAAANSFDGITDDGFWTFTTFDGDEPPVLTNEIGDLSLLVNADPIVYDLDSYFNDPDGESLSYEVIENTNSSLISTNVNGSDLTVSIASGEIGVGSLTIEASNAKSVSTSFNIAVNPPSLYIQTGSSVGGGPSQVFTDFSNSELEVADDFAVTASSGNSWYIQAISVVGSKSSGGDSPTEAIFRVYEDDSGLPGDIIYESDNLPIIPTSDDTDFQLILPEPLIMEAGNYWLSVLDVQSFSPNNTQWFWSYYESGTSDYVRRDPDGLLGGSWPVDWELSGDLRDMIFTIQGFETVNPPSDLQLSESENMAILEWTDNSVSEDGFIVELAVEDGEFTQVAALDANTTTYSETITATNRNITYRVSAIDAGGNRSTSISASILTIPAPPVFGDVTDVSSAGFTMNWTTPDEAALFTLDVSESDDFSSFLTGFEGISTSSLNATVTDRLSGTYFFRITASNASGTSGYSETGTVTLDPLGTLDEESISIYPNPGPGIYNIKGIGNEVSISVYDLSGKMVQEYLNGSSLIDLSELDDGSYILHIKNGNDVTTRTLIKQ